MTIQNPPIFIQAGSHPAEDVRRWIDTLVNAGTVLNVDLAVTQNGTPNMSVNVDGGRAYVSGTEATYQGMYLAENRGVQNVVISASDATNPRKDLIVVRIRDAAYSGATNSAAIEVVTGTPAASPVDPATPANSLVLARVLVPALSTTVVNANITDLRVRSYALGVSGARTRLDTAEAQLSKLPGLVQSGSAGVSLDAGGLGTITFPVAFGSVPVVTLTVQLSTGSQRTAQINSVTASSVVIRCFNAGTGEVSTTRNVHWIAVGTP